MGEVTRRKATPVEMLGIEIEMQLDDLYEKVDAEAQELGLKPSEVRMALRGYDLGDGYEDWYREGDEEWA